MWNIELIREGAVTLARQIYQTIRDGIMDDRIVAGEALPSSRELARQLGVSRNTVNEAYSMLLVEGFITSRQGAPTRVVEGLKLNKTLPQTLPEKAANLRPSYRSDFRTGQPDLRCFPRYLWKQLLNQAIDELPLSQYTYMKPDGLPVLQAEIAAWLFRSRGLSVDAPAIFVTAGATHALHLLAEILCDDEHAIVIEDPCHLGMLGALQGKGYPIHPTAVDENGIQPHLIDGHNAVAVYVTPSHQFPLGGILPATRRAALVHLARENDLYIIEDDYDSEFRYSGAPVAPMYSMDTQRVIYVGTFSKILFPGLRIGYTIVPPALQNRLRYARIHNDVQNPPFEQAALAKLLHARKLERYVQKMRKIYSGRRQALLEALEATFGKTWRCWGDAAGLHMALEFPGVRFEDEFTQACQKHQLNVTTLEHHCICKGKHLDKILLGYGHLDNEEIRAGVAALYQVMREAFPER